MIKHIVLFKFKTFESSEEKAAAVNEIKTGLESLMGVVPTLKAIEVGVNNNPNETFDLSLITLFDSSEDLHAYAVHPAHQVVVAKIGAIKEGRSCVDYIV